MRSAKAAGNVKILMGREGKFPASSRWSRRRKCISPLLSHLQPCCASELLLPRLQPPEAALPVAHSCVNLSSPLLSQLGECICQQAITEKYCKGRVCRAARGTSCVPGAQGIEQRLHKANNRVVKSGESRGQALEHCLAEQSVRGEAV